MAKLILCSWHEGNHHDLMTYAEWFGKHSKHALSVDAHVVPTLAEPAPFLNTFDPAVVRLLKSRESKALGEMLEQFPLLDGETVQEAWFTGLSAPCNNWVQGTLVYVRKTDQSTMAFVFPDQCFDLETGSLDHVIYRSYHHQIARVDWNLVSDLIDEGLQFASMASFAIPEYGAFISGGVDILRKIWTDYLSAQLLPLAPPETTYHKLMDVMNQHDIRLAADDIQTYLQWFQATNVASWDTQNKGMDVDIQYYDEKMDQLQNALKPTFSFLQDLTMLADKAHEIAGISVYMMGASLHLTMYKIYYLYDTVKRKSFSPYVLEMLKATERHIQHIEPILLQFEHEITERMSKIRNIERLHYPPYQHTFADDCYMFEDEEEQKTFYFTDHPLCPPPNYNSKQAAQEAHDTYYTEKFNQIVEKNYSTLALREKALSTLQQWKQTYQGLNHTQNSY